MTSSYWLHLFICIIFLLILLAVARFFVRRKQRFDSGTDKTRSIQIIDRKSLGHKEHLILIKVENETLLIGATTHSINLIKTVKNNDLT